MKERLISEIRKLTKRIGQAVRGGVTELAERLRVARTELAIRLARDFDTWHLVNAQGKSEFVDRETFNRRAESWKERKTFEARSSPPASSPDPVREIFGEPISIYTREQVLRDGVLVDVSRYAEGIFRHPVALTAALWAVVEDLPPETPGDRELQVRERAKEVLKAAAIQALNMVPRENSQVSFPFILQVREGLKSLDLVAHCGPGDRREPVVTIGFPIDF